MAVATGESPQSSGARSQAQEPVTEIVAAEDYSERFFFGILTADDGMRREGVNELVNKLSRSIRGRSFDGGRLFEFHKATVVRLANDAPFPEVREAFRALVAEAERRGLKMPRCSDSSGFVPGISISSADERTREIFVDTFLNCGHVSRAVRMMAHLPDYLVRYIATYRAIMRSPGPLSSPSRFYIGVMAAARHRSEYLMANLRSEFRMHGGDERWLADGDIVPAKLKALIPLNATLAVRPWDLTRAHFDALLNGPRDIMWSVGELLSAVVIMVHFHSLAGFANGCGLESDDKEESLVGNPTSDSLETRSTDDLVRVLRNHFESDDASCTSSPEGRTHEVQDTEDGEALTCGADCRGVANKGNGNLRQAVFNAECDTCAGLSVFPLSAVDFDVEKHQIFPYHDFGWSAEGYSLLSRFNLPLAELLDEQFNTILSLTDMSLGQTRGVDTAPFRQAVWYYAQRLLGIEHDDYDYCRMNKVLHRPLKEFVKKVVCQPDTVSRTDFDRMGLALRTEEKIHLIVLAIEARRQAVLLYGLRVLSQAMEA